MKTECDNALSSCPVCDGELTRFGTADYYLSDVPRVLTVLYRCPACGAMTREVDAAAVQSHCAVASYTRESNEENFRKGRTEYFRHLISLVRRDTGRIPKTCLDFGCSYGHLIEMLGEAGCEAYGIEFAESALQVCLQHGLRVRRSLEEWDSPARFDLISIIDSLYLVTDPVSLLESLRARLADDGHLLVRITNRNWILRGLRLTTRRTHFDRWLGDASIGYTRRTLKTLFQRTGFEAQSFHYWEPGKQLDLRRRSFYGLTAALATVSLGALVLTPGIVVVARKST